MPHIGRMGTVKGIIIWIRRAVLYFQINAGLALYFVSDEKAIVDIYNSVDLFVTPSLEENLPNTIMEAMACGVPCVGFNIDGIFVPT
jgi:glycosyltransferase involved in cell wall biosynthesis